MSRKKLEKLIEFLVPVLVVFTFVMILLFFLDEIVATKYEYAVYLILCLFGLLEVNIFIRSYSKIRKKQSGEDDLLLLKDYIEYNKKRREIEEKIESLTKQLMHSAVSEYLDVNRLAIDGQDKLSNKVKIDNKLLSREFGLTEIDTKIRENSAVFLTPFTNKGRKTFKICKDTLDTMGIYVRMTDNYVEKLDVLSNIILLIIQSEYVIANIEGRNPNVYYELGIAHAWGKKTIIISDTSNLVEDIGFDIRQKRIIMYKSDKELKEQLLNVVSNMK